MTFHKFQLLSFLSLVAVVSAGRMVLHEHRLQDKLLSVSMPGGSEFRQWLSIEDVKSYVQPSAVTVAAFTSFASAHGLDSTAISPHGDWFSIALPVSQANTLFAAHFEKFTNPKFARRSRGRCPSRSRKSWWGMRFSDAARRVRRCRGAVPPDSCKAADDSPTPACLQTLYGIPTTPATQTSSTLLVTGYTEQWAQRADLVAFRPDILPNTTYALDTLDGGTDPQQGLFDLDVIEANIDIQYTVGLATGVLVTFLSVGDDETEEAFFTQLLDTSTYLAGVTSPPSTMTTSYGGNEVDFGRSLATKICYGYMALSARGISVLFASGDNCRSSYKGGVRGGHDDETQCTNNTFVPVFPASCPYVTSVGATGNPFPAAVSPTSSLRHRTSILPSPHTWRHSPATSPGYSTAAGVVSPMSHSRGTHM
ncbi:peptidase S8/S53 domain-containing protein [Mycena olivaceomarginata]|nr:peptidase S8/S53 domain-containing protein [Mycena olivaceomarginata]